MAALLKKALPNTFQRFFRTEAVGGLILLLSGLAALALANSALGENIRAVLADAVNGNRQSFALADAAPVDQRRANGRLFFLLVGLEIKRELLVGELASAKKAALPIACAIGGMVLPAADLLDIQHDRSRRARLGHPDGDRHRFRVRSARVDRPARTNRCEGISDRPCHRR